MSNRVFYNRWLNHFTVSTIQEQLLFKIWSGSESRCQSKSKYGRVSNNSPDFNSQPICLNKPRSERIHNEDRELRRFVGVCICERVTKSLGIFSVGSYSVFLVVDTFFLELDKLEIIKACHDSQKCAVRRTERSGYDVDNVIPKFFLRLASPNFMLLASS